MSTAQFSRFMAASLIASACSWADHVPDEEPAANVPVSPGRLSAVPEVFPARVRVTAYELQGARGDVLDPDSLARQATTPQSLLKALGVAGDARILYQIDQEVNVLSEQILIGGAEPVKVASSETPDPAVNTVSYVNVGLILHLSARPAENGFKPDVSVEAKLSKVKQSNVAKNKLASIHVSQFSQTEPLEFGHPRVMLGSNSNPATAEDHSARCVIRYVFDELPQRTAGAGTAPPSVQSGRSADTEQPGFPAQFEVTAYQVKIAPDRLVELDSETLERETGTSEGLLAGLGKIGEARITYGISQTVNVLSDQVMVSTNEWLTTSSRVATEPGRDALFSRTSQRFGLSVRFAGARPTRGATRPNVTMLLQSSGLGHGDIPLNPEDNADRTYVRSITHSEVLEFGRPRVMLSAVSKPDLATVSVFRYLFSPAAK